VVYFLAFTCDQQQLTRKLFGGGLLHGTFLIA
jgi:hypothetical protein